MTSSRIPTIPNGKNLPWMRPKTLSTEEAKQLFLKPPTTRDFHTVAVVGQGAYGMVRVVRHIPSREIFALKQMSKVDLTFKSRESLIMQEINVLYKARSPWIPRLYYAWQDDHFIYLLMEFTSGGDMMKHLAEKRHFSEPICRFYVAELVLALAYVHLGLQCVHRDIKPENILLDSEGHIKLADFGLSRFVGIKNDAKGEEVAAEYAGSVVSPKPSTPTSIQSLQDKTAVPLFIENQEPVSFHERLMTGAGTTDYMAPEIHRHCRKRRQRGTMIATTLTKASQKAFPEEGYTRTVDWWSVGVVMFDMLFGTLPFTDRHRIGHVTTDRIIHWKTHLKSLPSRYPVTPECEDFLRHLLADPEERFQTAAEAATHPWLRAINWEHIREQTAPLQINKVAFGLANFDLVDIGTFLKWETRKKNEAELAQRLIKLNIPKPSGLTSAKHTPKVFPSSWRPPFIVTKTVISEDHTAITTTAPSRTPKNEQLITEAIRKTAAVPLIDLTRLRNNNNNLRAKNNGGQGESESPRGDAFQHVIKPVNAGPHTVRDGWHASGQNNISKEVFFKSPRKINNGGQHLLKCATPWRSPRDEPCMNKQPAVFALTERKSMNRIDSPTPTTTLEAWLEERRAKFQLTITPRSSRRQEISRGTLLACRPLTSWARCANNEIITPKKICKESKQNGTSSKMDKNQKLLQTEFGASPYNDFVVVTSPQETKYPLQQCIKKLNEKTKTKISSLTTTTAQSSQESTACQKPTVIALPAATIVDTYSGSTEAETRDLDNSLTDSSDPAAEYHSINSRSDDHRQAKDGTSEENDGGLFEENTFPPPKTFIQLQQVTTNTLSKNHMLPCSIIINRQNTSTMKHENKTFSNEVITTRCPYVGNSPVLLAQQRRATKATTHLGLQTNTQIFIEGGASSCTTNRKPHNTNNNNSNNNALPESSVSNTTTGLGATAFYKGVTKVFGLFNPVSTIFKATGNIKP